MTTPTPAYVIDLERVEPTKRVSDADGAFCQDCGTVFDVSGAPWHWRKSQAMHERGTGHTTQMFRLKAAL